MCVLGPDEERIEIWSGEDLKLNHFHFTAANLAATASSYRRFFVHGFQVSSRDVRMPCSSSSCKRHRLKSCASTALLCRPDSLSAAPARTMSRTRMWATAFDAC
jgi:hypothetical protein